MRSPGAHYRVRRCAPPLVIGETARCDAPGFVLFGSFGLQIEMLLPDRLVPYIRNAHTHSADQVAQIAASMAEFGFTNPKLIGEDGVVIAGHSRTHQNVLVFCKGEDGPSASCQRASLR